MTTDRTPADGWARCDKCGQKLASDEEGGEPYCLNCESCSRCGEIHHMEDRCQDATEAERQLVSLRGLVNAAVERAAQAEAQLAEQRSINAALTETLDAVLDADSYRLRIDDGSQCKFCADPLTWHEKGDCTWRAAEKNLADPSKAATEWRTQVLAEGARAERERLLALFDLGWRKETSDPYPDGVTAVIGYSIRRVRDRLLGHREDDPECDCESCRSIAAEETAQ